MRKKNLLIMAGLFFFMAFAIPLVAATSGVDFEIDDAVVTAITNLAVFGFVLFAAIQALKEWLKIKDGWVIALSAVCSFAYTGFYLLQTEAFSWIAFAVYGILVTAEANGFYKLVKPILKFLLTLIKEKKEDE